MKYKYVSKDLFFIRFFKNRMIKSSAKGIFWQDAMNKKMEEFI